MSCTRFIPQIQEMVDGTLGAIRRAELEMHLEQCDDCRALLADRRRIHAAAASLDELQPPDRVWLQIAGRLRQEGRLAETAAASTPRRSHFALLAVAAALVIAVGASLMLLWPRAGTTPAPAQAGTTTPPGTAPAASRNP